MYAPGLRRLLKTSHWPVMVQCPQFSTTFKPACSAMCGGEGAQCSRQLGTPGGGGEGCQGHTLGVRGVRGGCWKLREGRGTQIFPNSNKYLCLLEVCNSMPAPAANHLYPILICSPAETALFACFNDVFERTMTMKRIMIERISCAQNISSAYPPLMHT